MKRSSSFVSLRLPTTNTQPSCRHILFWSDFISFSGSTMASRVDRLAEASDLNVFIRQQEETAVTREHPPIYSSTDTNIT